MQVDSGVPSLSTVLQLVITYPTSAPALRLAIRQRIADADELTAILKILTRWVGERCNEEKTQLLPSEVRKDMNGVLVPVLAEKPKGDLPSLDKVNPRFLTKEFMNLTFSPSSFSPSSRFSSIRHSSLC